MVFFYGDGVLYYNGVIGHEALITPKKTSWNYFNNSMYFTFSGGKDFESFINFGFSSIPILHSSISDSKGSRFGFLGISFESNKSSKGVNPLGKKLSLRLIISESSLIISSISSCFRFCTSDFVNLVG